MQPNPYLSVAIPTYNREAELIQCLESIVPQARKLGIYIYISDNASSYDVLSTVERFRVEYPWIVYHRNRTNLGLDTNVRQVLSMVESEYVWAFCDDDIMANGALEKVLPICQSGKYDLILPDRELRSRNMSQVIPEGSSVNGVTQPTESSDPIEMFIRHGYLNYTFVGCLLVRMSAWRRVNNAKYVSYPWFEHMCILAEMMVEGKALVLPDRLIYLRSDNITYSEQWYFVWASHFPRGLCALPAAYPLESRRKVLDSVGFGTFGPFRIMLRGRSRGALNWRNRKLILEPYYKLQARKWVLAVYLSLLIPTIFFRGGKYLRAMLLGWHNHLHRKA